MIGIKSIASYVPANGVDNYAQGAKFSKDEDFILGKIGSAFLPRKDADQETSDLCVEAVNALFANNPQLKRESIDALIVVTQNGDAEGLPHTAAIVQDKLRYFPGVLGLCLRHLRDERLHGSHGPEKRPADHR